jgi:hypothetical protein
MNKSKTLQQVLIYVLIACTLSGFFFPYFTVETIGDYTKGERLLLDLYAFGSAHTKESGFEIYAFAPVITLVMSTLLAMLAYVLFKLSNTALVIGILRLALVLSVLGTVMMVYGLAWSMNFDEIIQKEINLMFATVFVIPSLLLFLLRIVRKSFLFY